MPGHDYFAVVQYDGRAFCGWQRQQSESSVQGALEDALAPLGGGRIPIHAAGRTDTGVHALAQVISFALPELRPAAEIRRALNARTPPEVYVADLDHAPAGFHARKDATARRYRFLVGCDEGAASPFRRGFEWAVAEPLDAELLRAAAAMLLGEHDFSALSATGSPRPHYRCTVVAAEWQARPDHEGFIFTVEADRFLYRMVRFIVGTMVDVARGRRPIADLEALLAPPGAVEASPPAPAHGLYMVGARYPQPELRRVNAFVRAV